MHWTACAERIIITLMVSEDTMQDCDPGLAAAPLPSRNLLEFLGWVASRPRSYVEAMEAWRTSCPRLSIWEDATGDDLVRMEQAGAASQGQAVVRLTDRGAALLTRGESAPAASAPGVQDDLP
jgi:hypothetical protein